jgi:hypothetical protein
MMTHERARLTRILLGSVIAIGFMSAGAAGTRADSLQLGTFSFDPLIPGFIDVFTVNNSTGSSSIPGFPVVNDVTFAGANLSLPGNLNLPFGDVGPGGSLFPVLDFESFSSATLQAVLSTTLFTLSDGTHFQASSDLVTSTILPSNGTNLTPGTDFASITVPGSFVTSQVPEPPTWSLLVALAGWLLLRRRALRRA